MTSSLWGYSTFRLIDTYKPIENSILIKTSFELRTMGVGSCNRFDLAERASGEMLHNVSGHTKPRH